MKKIIYLLLFLLPLLSLSAQTHVDSLLNVLNTTQLKYEEQIQLYWDITLAYRNNNFDKAIHYAYKGLHVAEKENNNLWIARFSRILGFTYIHKNEYDSSALMLNNAIASAIKADNKQEENIATVYIGSLYLQQGKYEEALTCFMDALPSIEHLQQTDQLATTLLNVAITYRSLRNNDKALQYCEKAYEVAEKNNIAYPQMVSFEVMGDIHYSRQQYDSAVTYLLKAYELACELNDKPRLVTSTQMLTKAYSYLEQYDKAEKYANECLETANLLGTRHQLFMAWSSMSYLKFEQKQYKESERYADQMWQTDSTELFWARNTSYYLCKTSLFLNNPQKASYFLDKYSDIRDEISDEELYESLAEMEAKYETEKKETRILALEKERKLHIGLGAAVVLALLSAIGFLFYRHRLRRKLAEQQIKQLEQEKKLIAARAALETEKVERELIARDLHDGVGAMLSVVKNNLNIMKAHLTLENREVDYFNKVLDGLDKSMVELRRVAYHIMPAPLAEKGLFAALDDFCRSIPEAEFHCAEPEFRFDTEKEMVLYRCAYELVNNALRHAGASRIEVHLSTDHETAYLSVVDNGCGFDPRTAPQGMGLKNMRTRLAAFDGTIEIYSEPGKGTEVNIEIS